MLNIYHNFSLNRLLYFSDFSSVASFLFRLNRLQKVTVAETEQLFHIIQLDLRDTGLQELDVRALCNLEVLRCDRNSLSLLRVSGHALKSLHASRNGTDTYDVLFLTIN